MDVVLLSSNKVNEPQTQQCLGDQQQSKNPAAIDRFTQGRGHKSPEGKLHGYQSPQSQVTSQIPDLHLRTPESKSPPNFGKT